MQLEEAVKLIAKKEKLEPSDKEYEEGMQEYADKAGADPIPTKSRWEKMF